MQIRRILSRKNIVKKPTLSEGVSVLATSDVTGVISGAIASGIIGALSSSFIPILGTVIGAAIGVGVVLANRVSDKETIDPRVYIHTNSKGTTYILHGRNRVSSTGKTSTIYFFTKKPRDGALGAIPAGYKVTENNKGVPSVIKVG